MHCDRSPSHPFRSVVTRARLGVGLLTLLSGAAALVLAVAVPTTVGAQRSAPAATSLVFDGVTVVDVEQGKLIPDRRVVVVGNRIQAVGDGSAVVIPAGAQIVDARGKYLIPGLWDLHTHPRSFTHLFYPLFIANGVTGIRDAWSEVPLDTVVQWWHEIVAGTRVGPPRQLLSGPPHPVSYDEMVARKTSGANFIKVYPFDFAKAAAARRVGLPFGGHVNGVSAIEASDSGASILDHVNSAGDMDRRCVGPQATVERCRPVAERFRQNGSWWVPTLTRRMTFNRQASPNPGTATEAVSAHLVEMANQFWSGSVPKGNWLQGVVPAGGTDSLRFLSIVQRVGLPILAGTDAGAPVRQQEPPGFALHAELAIYVTEGLAPLEALQAATLNPAKMLGATDSLGTVAAGKLADLVLLDANPLADITNTTTIRAVVANGRYFDRAILDRLLADVQVKAKEAPEEP